MKTELDKKQHTHTRDQHKNQKPNEKKKIKKWKQKGIPNGKGAAPLLEAGQQDLIRFYHSCEQRSKCVSIYTPVL